MFVRTCKMLPSLLVAEYSKANKIRVSNSQITNMNRHPNKPTFPERNRPYPKIPLSVNRAKLSIPYKSELCRLFQRGKCNFGHNCHFAHSESEVRKPDSMEKHADREDGKRNNPVFKTSEYCAHFARGIDCPFGERCRFHHKYRDNTVLRKTRLCWQWERFGGCPYGVTCCFAHGNEELQESSGLPSRTDNVAESSDEAGIKISKKLRLKDRRYFTNWDIATISRIYADN